MKDKLFWILIISIGYLLISFLFFPIHFQNIKNTFSQAGGRVASSESIDMGTSCDFRGVEFFGYDVKDMIKLDCENACGREDLSYSSYGCPKNKFTCYCN